MIIIDNYTSKDVELILDRYPAKVAYSLRQLKTGVANVLDAGRLFLPADKNRIAGMRVAAIVACSAFDDLPALGIVERVRFPDAIVLASVIASVRSDTVVAGSSLIATISQGTNTTTCEIPIGSTSVEVAATWTIAADTEVVFTVTQTATAQGLKVTLLK